MNRLRISLLALLVLSLPLAAQAKKETPADDKQVEKTKGQEASGHVSVEVILKNEGVFMGVALKGRLVEKCIRHQYRPLAADQQRVFGAGIRVWYYDDLLGFLFIPYRQIAEVKIGSELTVAQLDGLKIKVKERRLAKEAARADDGKKAAVKKADESKAPGVEAVQNALLQKFPPSDGFTPERYEQVQRASITGSGDVSALEKDWVKVFPDWMKAFKASQAPKPAPVVAKKKDEPKPEVKTDGVLIGVKAPKAEGKSSGGDAGRGIR